MDYLHRRSLKPLIGAIAVLAWAGCAGDADDSAMSEADEEERRTAADAAASCVADYTESPCELLTEQLVRGAVDGVPTEVEQESQGGSLTMCTYSWPSDRTATTEAAGRTFTYDVSNQVSLSWIRSYEENAAEQFRLSYLPTQEEVERGREMMREQFEEEAEEGGLTEQQREMGEGIAESAMTGMTFERVEGVASNASWNAGDKTLYVLDGSTSFQIKADVSADDAANRETAIVIAEAVMASCR